MELTQILTEAVTQGASDIFIIPGRPVSYKVDNNIITSEGDFLKAADTEMLIRSLYELAEREEQFTLFKNDDDFSVSLSKVGRFRVNIFKQRGSLSAVLRLVPFELPDFKEMGIPEDIMDLANLKKGLVLVTGPTGSGKSTTMSYIIDRINATRSCHILTLEDPIEFLHKHKKSIVSQREINIDTDNYSRALRAGLRQSPDVILVGEMRDLETIEIAMTAAETGHLVLSTLHTVGASNAIDRIIDVFPAAQQQQMRIQMSMVLQAIVSQQLVPGKDSKQVVAFELLKSNNAIKTMIREGKSHQIESVIHSAADMKTMDASLIELTKAGKIEPEVAVEYALNKDIVKRMLGA